MDVGRPSCKKCAPDTLCYGKISLKSVHINHIEHLAYVILGKQFMHVKAGCNMYRYIHFS